MGKIHRIDWGVTQFVDVAGVARPLRGVVLEDRAQYKEQRAALDDLLAGLDNPHPIALWNTNQRFRSLCTNLLLLAGVEVGWAIAPKQRQQKIWGLILPYEVADGRVCRGLIDEQEFAPDGLWEAVTGDPNNAPKDTAQIEREAFSSLRFRDALGRSIELQPLPAPGHRRMEALVDLSLTFEGNDLRALYDDEPEFRAILHEILALWRLTPQQLTFGQAARLVFDNSGAMAYLRQLQYPPVHAPRRGDPLPEDEDPIDSVIALLMSEGAGLIDAIKAVSAIPYPQLQSILRSRGRMLEDAQARTKGKRGAVRAPAKVPENASARLEALLQRPPLQGGQLRQGEALGSIAQL